MQTNQRKAHLRRMLIETDESVEHNCWSSFFVNPLDTESGPSCFTILLRENKRVKSVIPMYAKTDRRRSLITIPYRATADRD